jgi:L-seryl-tRNA(Ser) seleniumtransferase
MKNAPNSQLFRELPSVDELIHAPAIAVLSAQHGTAAVTDAARMVLARLREEISTGLLNEPALQLALTGIASAIEEQVRRATRYSLRNVINATGVILHTNLGRAPLAKQAVEHMREIAMGYSNLEFEIETGERGKRDVHVERLLRRLLSEENTGEEKTGKDKASISTIVVNNNAAAVLLALNTLAEDGEVIVSRGELVEIGGSFRIPDVMAKSGAVLREVGTTNRTRLGDYERAINERTRLLLRVHRSNFEITGFTEQASTAELVALARKRSLALMEDLGSGALVDLRNFGINGEPTVVDSLRAGIDVVTYSGDKLLGGPQAGLISGRRDLVARMRSNSLFRALRVDKLTYATLEATLLAYVKREHDTIPALKMMQATKEEIGRRAEDLARQVQSAKVQAEVIDGESVIGGGAAPSAVLATRLVAVSCDGISAEELASRLRASDPPVVARVEEGRVLLDLRTVFEEQDELVAAALNRIAL